MEDSAAPVFQGNLGIPVDLFVSRKHPGLKRGEVGFAVASGNIVFRTNTKSPENKRVLFDASGNPLISIYFGENGSWEAYRGDDNGENRELIFTVERTLNKLTRTELEVFIVGEHQQDSESDLKVKGFSFQKSCTIYKGNTIVAQTSLMYKLKQIFVKRGKFRLTIFPGFGDHALIAALIVIFFYGKE